MEAADESEIRTFSSLDTISRSFALTFEGMGSKETMGQITGLLAQYQAGATFFLPGIRVAQEPDIAQQLAQAGYEIGNNTLHRYGDLAWRDPQDIFDEISLSAQVIEQATGTSPLSLRVKGGEYGSAVCKAAVAAGCRNAVGYDINMQTASKTTQEVEQYFTQYIKRGDIVTIDTEKEDAAELVEFVLQQAAQQNFKVVSVSDLLAEEYQPEQAVDLSADSGKASVFSYAYTTQSGRWPLRSHSIGDGHLLEPLLDALDKNNIRATFFLQGLTVADHPEYVQEILSRGHEVEAGGCRKPSFRHECAGCGFRAFQNGLYL